MGNSDLQQHRMARVRLQEPRIPPLPEPEWSEEAREALAPFIRRGADYRMIVSNAVGTAANHPKYGTYMLSLNWFLMQASSLPARDRELLQIRASWLAACEFEFSKHMHIGKVDGGLSDEELQRIAEGPAAPGWDTFDSALLQAVDELYSDTCISNETWDRLGWRYNVQQLIDVPATVGLMLLMCKQFNSYGIQLAAGEPRYAEVRRAHIPTKTKRDLTAPLPREARIQPLPDAQWPESFRRALANDAQHHSLQNSIGENFLAVLANHPDHASSLLPYAWYIYHASALPVRDREILALRTSWLSQSEYAVEHHKGLGVLSHEEIELVSQGPRAPGCNQLDAALLQAADELCGDAFVTDSVWRVLAETYTKQQLMDAVLTVGLTHLMCMGFNSYGICVEPRRKS